jgi:hypothetical protein
MKAVSRGIFLAVGNLCWFAQAGIEVLAPQLHSYLTWRRLAFKPELQIGCFRDSYSDSLPDRIFVVGLVWLLSAPLMTAIALKLPRDWPPAMGWLCWRRQQTALSVATLLAVLAAVAWPLIAAARAPVADIQVLEMVRIALIAMPALYYRALLLSAARV